MFTTFPVLAAATRISVCLQRNAGIWSTSAYSAAIAASSAEWISVTVGTPNVSCTFFNIFNACLLYTSLQGIVVVGDIDVDAIEAKIKTMFADVPAQPEAAERVYYPVNDNKEPIIIIEQDK